MAVVTYKCPNCDGGLIFDAESQKFHCEFCLSYFTEEELIKAGQAKSEEQIVDNAESTNSEDSQESGEDFEGVVYTCPSCGAEVVVDSTKAASQCCFCHNPVVISGRLDGKFRPDCVIPFAIDRDEAIERFLEWTKKQVFAPKNFFSKNRLTKLREYISPIGYATAKVRLKSTPPVPTGAHGDVEILNIRKPLHTVLPEAATYLSVI